MWLNHWDWFFVLSVAWLLFDLFMQPVLSIVIASFKFGWNDFANGFWLWRKDRHVHRGRANLVFYTATGLWRITVTTFAVTIVGVIAMGIVAAAGPAAAGNGQNGAELTAVSILIVMFCFVLSSLATWLAIYIGLRRRLRIWIDSTVRYSRRNRIWPPVPNGKNQLSRVITSSLVFLSVGTISVSIAVLANIGQRGGQMPVLVLSTPILCVAFCGFLLLVGRNWLLKSLAADSPTECWSGEAEAQDFALDTAQDYDFLPEEA